MKAFLGLQGLAGNKRIDEGGMKMPPFILLDCRDRSVVIPKKFII